MSATVIEELVTLLGFELDHAGLHNALKSYTDLHNLASDVLHVVRELGHEIIEPLAKVVEIGSEAVRMSRRLGTTITGFQELNEVAKLSHVSTEQLAHALDHINRTAYEAGTHKEIGKAYADLGVKLHDLNGKLKTSDVLFGDIAEQLEKHPEKRALIFQILGRGAGELIPLLVQGKGHLEELKETIRDTGLILSEETAVQAKELGLAWKLLNLNAEGLIRRLGSGLLPIAGRVVATMTALWKANRAIINERLDQFIGFVTKAIQPLYDALRVVWSVLSTVVDLFGGWKNIMLILGSVIGFHLLSTLGKFAMSLKDATEGLVKFFLTMITGGLVPALLGAALLAVVAIIALVIQDLKSSDSLIKQMMNEGENPEDSNIIKFFKVAINFVRAFGLAMSGVGDIFQGIFSNEGGPGLKALRVMSGYKKISGDAIANESLVAGTAREKEENRAANFVGPMRDVDKPQHQINWHPVEGHPGQFVGSETSSFVINQTFNGPADPAAVKNASEQGVQRGARELDEERRQKTYNSGGRAGYR